MAYKLMNPLSIQREDANGNPLSGGTIEFYINGTTTPSPIYFDAAGSAYATSVTLNSLGEPSNGGNVVSLYQDDDVVLKAIIKDSAGAAFRTITDISAAAQLSEIENRTVDSISGLRASDKTAVDHVFVEGYYAAGDGGGGHYWYDSTDMTSADNDGTIIVANDGGRWKLCDTDSATIRTFGAVGDGVTNDAAAITAMASALDGRIVIPAGEYLIESIQIADLDRVTVIGAGRPALSDDLSTLEGGSILIGTLYVRSNQVDMADFGIDSGSGRTLTNRGGLWCDANEDESGSGVNIRNIAVLNTSSAGTWHGVTAQGYTANDIHNIIGARQEFLVVVKGQVGSISNIIGKDCRTSGVFVKGDTPENGGDVANASALNWGVSSVEIYNESDNTTCSAVYVASSSAAVSKVNISNVVQVYGLYAVRLLGGATISDPTLNIVNITNIVGDLCQVAVGWDGYVYDVNASNIIAVNPVTGKALTMGANSYNWNITNVSALVTDSDITGDVIMDVYGIGSWDGVTCRNAFRDMEVQVQSAQLAQISCGKTGYGVGTSLDATLTGINSAAADATYTPILRIGDDSNIVLSGRFDLTSSSNKAFCNIPFSTGKQQIFACGAIVGGSYQTIAVRLNDFQLSVEPTLVSGTVDLSGIRISM